MQYSNERNRNLNFVVVTTCGANNEIYQRKTTDSPNIVNQGFLIKSTTCIKFNSSTTTLLLPGLEQGRLLQRTTTIVHFDNVTISRQNTRATHFHIFGTGVRRESPLERLQDLLTSRKLEFTAANRFNDMRFMGVLRSDRHEPPHQSAYHTSDAYPTRADRLPHTKAFYWLARRGTGEHEYECGNYPYQCSSSSAC
jgi:hypothetical protein